MHDSCELDCQTLYFQANRNRKSRGYGLTFIAATWFLTATWAAAPSSANQTLRHPQSLEQLLLAADRDYLVQQVQSRGDAARGAIVFYTSSAACARCHAVSDQVSPLGPNLSQMPRATSLAYVVESLLEPSKVIAKGYETVQVLTDDGQVHVGLVVAQNEQQWTLRSLTNLTEDLVIDADTIEESVPSKQSLMPAGLVGALPDQAAFLDLVAYVTAVAQGGPETARQLEPDEHLKQPVDDTVNLDHAGILRRLKQSDFNAGQALYQSHCIECHGADGQRASLPTARAFATQKLRYGADPFSMFMTLSRGNGLMAPMRQLTPKERYQVVHYVREAFMKSGNPDYHRITEEYLAKLPSGTDDGNRIEVTPRDFGPALASQLGRDYPSVLSIRVGKQTICYDTHTLDQADLWAGDFVDHSDTQHTRPRGEGTIRPGGPSVRLLRGWQWRHDPGLLLDQTQRLPRGPLPDAWLQYYGHYLHDDQVVLHYRIDGREIWESPTDHPTEGDISISHRLRIEAGNRISLIVSEIETAADANAESLLLPLPSHQRQASGITTTDEGHEAVASAFAVSGLRSDERWQQFAAFHVRGDVADIRWQVDAAQRVWLHFPADDKSRILRIDRVVANTAERAALLLDGWKTPPDTKASNEPLADPKTLAGSGGEARWPQTLQATGYLGLEQGAYALDTIGIPEQTPWNTWFRTSCLDFFSDGRMAVGTYGGDVWIVSGIDAGLERLTWKRFAGGLYEPMGLRIVDDQVYVTCKDRITRLHDFTGNDEADFYESFSADSDVSVNFHAFNFDLQTDVAGNFYYAKSGHGADFALPGAIIRISPDGRQRSVVATGFRSPNGMGMLPDGRPTASDNQGQWMPASKINVIAQDQFYGWVPTYSTRMWAPDGGRIDPKAVVAPETFTKPIVWMPQEFDNSSGGQLWVDDPRWGPLSGRLLHTSFGKGWMAYLLMQKIGKSEQAAIIKLPFDFRTGIMRARVNPADGQVYATGLDGWNGGGRPGLQDKGIQRLRYTGRPEWMVTQATVADQTLRLRFTLPIGHASGLDATAFTLEAWNYRWQASYGSDQYAPSTNKVGREIWTVANVEVDPDGCGVCLTVPDLQPVDQLRLICRFQGLDGTPLLEEIYWTIHATQE